MNKKLALLLAGVLALSAFTGCSKKEETPITTQSEGVSMEEPTKIVAQAGDYSELDAMVSSYEPNSIEGLDELIEQIFKPIITGEHVNFEYDTEEYTEAQIRENDKIAEVIDVTP